MICLSIIAICGKKIKQIYVPFTVSGSRCQTSVSENFSPSARNGLAMQRMDAKGAYSPL